MRGVARGARAGAAGSANPATVPIRRAATESPRRSPAPSVGAARGARPVVTQFAGGRADEAFAPFRYRTPALPGSTARFDGAHKRVADARDRSEGTGHC